jgi:trimeric autotransporter adhesin
MQRTLLFCLAILNATVCALAQSTITTFAGRDPKFEGNGQAAVLARIGLPRGVALDGQGNVYFTDSGFSLVMKVDTGGRLSVVANSSQVSRPQGIAADRQGNIFVVDTEFKPQPRPDGSMFLAPSGRIRKIAADGSVSTIAGSGSDPDGEDIPAVEARLSASAGFAIDAGGNLYVAEVGRNRVRRIDREGKIRTVAGNGRPVFGFVPPGADVGDGGPATQATLARPADVAVDKDGGLLIADGTRIRRVDREGIIRTVAGGGLGPLDEGPATQMDLYGASGIAAAPDGSFYLFDWYSITRVTPDGQSTMITDWAGGPEPGDGRPASEVYVPGTAAFSIADDAYINGMAVDDAGNLYLADVRNGRLRRIGTDGIITTVAGSAPFRFAGDGGSAAEALLNWPGSVAASPDGSIYIFDRNNCRIRRVGPDGTIGTIAGNGICAESGPDAESATEVPVGNGITMTADTRGNVYVSEGGSVRMITPGGQLKTIVNNLIGAPGTFGDVTGPAREARIMGPITGIYIDRDDNLYIADFLSNRVRKITSDGMISTFAGSGPAPGRPVFAGDGGPAVEARLAQPAAVTGDREGNIYILDSGNRRIRKVGKDGIIRTVAGSDVPINPAAGPLGSAGMVVDASGNLYLTEQANHRVRRITPDGRIATIAGTGEAGFDGDGGPSDQATLNSPTGLAMDASGNLYVADSGNHRIRKIAGK